MALTLYDGPISPNARKVRLLAAELGLPLERKVLSFAKGEMRAPDYLALNPNGSVPTLDDDGFVLWESAAILRHLAGEAAGARAGADRSEAERAARPMAVLVDRAAGSRAHAPCLGASGQAVPSPGRQRPEHRRRCRGRPRPLPAGARPPACRRRLHHRPAERRRFRRRRLARRRPGDARSSILAGMRTSVRGSHNCAPKPIGRMPERAVRGAMRFPAPEAKDITDRRSRRPLIHADGSMKTKTYKPVRKRRNLPYDMRARRSSTRACSFSPSAASISRCRSWPTASASPSPCSIAISRPRPISSPRAVRR